MAREITKQEKFLAYLVEKGMYERYGNRDDLEEVVKPRLKEELRVITSLGFSEYFLILWDIMKFCRENGIAVGPARGSAGGAAVSYCLYITDVDPLKFDLIFERFLNDERRAMPDIDVDICWWNRQRVIDYIVQKYGEDKTAQIVTFGTLKPKALLQDVGRVLHIPKKDVEMLKSLIPEDEKMTLDQLLEENEEFRNALEEIAAKEPRLMPALRKLEGIHRNESLHAGGIIISREPLYKVAPVFKKSGKGRQAVQYEMTDAEAVGLLKMDILGLKTVTQIDWAEKDIRKFFDPNFNIRKYPLDDKLAFDIINRGDTAGIFQLEGTGITKFAQDLHIESFNDIVALLALYRPGTLDSGAAQQYIDRKNGREPVTYPHPDLEPILKDTYGIMLYQEQVMLTLGVMCGYSMGQADTMRKAIGKKDAELMEQQLEQFRKYARSPHHGKRAYDEQTIETVAGFIKTFGRYGFNKSHAVAYAYLCYWTAVLKARYPAPFFAAWLNVTEDGARQGWIIEQAIRHGVKILPPDINHSQHLFTVTDKDTIRFGLTAVKGMGKSFVEKILQERESRGHFSGYVDFCRRLPNIPADKKEALVGAGAFDFDRYHRGFLYKHARTINEEIKKYSERDEHVLLSKLEDVPEMKPLEKAELEKKYVNFYISANPITMVQEELRLYGASVGVPIENLWGRPVIGGRITRIHTTRTKNGDLMAFVNVYDGIEEYDVTIFPDLWKDNSHWIEEDKYALITCEIGQYKGKKTLQAVGIQEIDLKNRNVAIVIDIGNKTDMLSLAQLKYTLDQATSGSSAVYFWVRNGRYRILLRSSSYRIKVTDELMATLRNIFGQDCITFRES